MNQAQLDQLQKEAEEMHAELKADFPNFASEMSTITEMVYAEAVGLPLKEVIYKSLMTGAALIHNENARAAKASQDVLSGLLQKGGAQDMPPGLFKKQ